MIIEIELHSVEERGFILKHLLFLLLGFCFCRNGGPLTNWIEISQPIKSLWNTRRNFRVCFPLNALQMYRVSLFQTSFFCFISVPSAYFFLFFRFSIFGAQSGQYHTSSSFGGDVIPTHDQWNHSNLQSSLSQPIISPKDTR